MDEYGLTGEVRQESGHMLITVAGDADVATAPQRRERLAGPAAGGTPIVVDLEPVTFIDGTEPAAARDVLVNGHRRHARVKAGLAEARTGAAKVTRCAAGDLGRTRATATAP